MPAKKFDRGNTRNDVKQTRVRPAREDISYFVCDWWAQGVSRELARSKRFGLRSGAHRFQRTCPRRKPLACAIGKRRVNGRCHRQIHEQSIPNASIILLPLRLVCVIMPVIISTLTRSCCLKRTCFKHTINFKN